MKKPEPLDESGLWEYALRRLSGRAYSIGELRDKLRQRAARDADVGAVLARLKEYGYVDDRRMAENFAVSRLENEGVGRMKVVRDLRKRRVAPAVAEKAASEAYREADEAALIEAYLRRKYRSAPLEVFLAEPKNLASAYRRLRSAGFSPGNSIRVLKRFAREGELLDSLTDDDRDPQS